jgi:hypothetical protein
MLLNDISHLKPCGEQAVIINVNTKLMTTLALVSALRHAGMPVLLMDCQSKDGSFDHFSKLMNEQSFDLLSVPLKPHGQTLDWFFKNITAKKVLLIDSDLEILGPEILKFFREWIDQEQTFGCGFINGPQWLTDHKGTFLKDAYYQERMWMPLTMLKTSFVKEAIGAGRTFDASIIYNDFPISRRLSVMMAKLRHRFGWLRKWDLGILRSFRNSYYGHKPSLIYADTGAEIYQHLRYKRELWFAGLPEPYHPRFVTHFFGTTRNALGEEGPHSGKRHEDNLTIAQRRLREIYGVSVSA